VASTIATKGALRNRWQVGPAVPLSGKLQTASRKTGTCRRKGPTNPMTSQTRDRGTERRAETAVFGRLFLQRMHHYRVLAKDKAMGTRRLDTNPREVILRIEGKPVPTWW
jgi:hypothetical protein